MAVFLAGKAELVVMHSAPHPETGDSAGQRYLSLTLRSSRRAASGLGELNDHFDVVGFPLQRPQELCGWFAARQ